jgi:hypothetical protein
MYSILAVRFGTRSFTFVPMVASAVVARAIRESPPPIRGGSVTCSPCLKAGLVEVPVGKWTVFRARTDRRCALLVLEAIGALVARGASRASCDRLSDGCSQFRLLTVSAGPSSRRPGHQRTRVPELSAATPSQASHRS